MGRRVEGNPLVRRMRSIERRYHCGRLDPRKPFVIRLDGRSFSRWTGGLEKPFDMRLVNLFIETTKALFRELDNLRFAYGQSDEVSLLFFPLHPNSQPIFGGKVYKVLSLSASIFTATFNRFLPHHLPEKSEPANFDSRVIQFESVGDVRDYFLWRWKDAVRNSKNSFARLYLSPKEMAGKTSGELVEIAKVRGGEWEALPLKTRYGWALYADYSSGKLRVAEVITYPFEKVEGKVRESLRFLP
ncbi:tRNA(His) guanylyltransferase Thg1 family protein [Thermococcus sp.]|uniref:tRNA(His) guanylyltransferase Thg1 family protein n=1 Tax=Thermococcus sp. TaxID=35749 RepID=UPI00262B7EB4|nr:tRNA(His) guanylyltransferase Thg1 family protein [Thermococcus sp.]